LRIDTTAGSWIFIAGQVAGLLLNAKIEIDAVAFLPAGPAA